MDVTIGEGPAAKTFKLHKGVLTFYSGYFEKALNGQFREAHSSVVEISDTNANVFETVLYWLYNRRFTAAAEDHTIDWDTIVDLWIFGDAHDVPLLQNTAINALHQKVVKEWIVPTAQIVPVYENTVHGSQLRQYLIDAFGKLGGHDVHLAKGEEYLWTKEALCDLVRVIWFAGTQRPTKEAVSKWDMCQYHVHREGVKCGSNAAST